MTRKEAKELFRADVDAYGKPKSIMSKIDRIYDEFEKELSRSKSGAVLCENCRGIFPQPSGSYCQCCGSPSY